MVLHEYISSLLSSFFLVGLAEIGDKSQLVCMTLAARHRHWPVILGAAVAFILLNTLAVWFGAGVAAWMPEKVTAALVALLFGIFGIHALLTENVRTNETVVEKPSHGVFITTLALIFVAEFGDKTQIAVAGLASQMASFPVWLAATLALVLVSALGVWVGRTVLQRLPLIWLHRLGGGLFLLFAALSAWHAIK